MAKEIAKWKSSPKLNNIFKKLFGGTIDAYSPTYLEKLITKNKINTKGLASDLTSRQIGNVVGGGLGKNGKTLKSTFTPNPILNNAMDTLDNTPLASGQAGNIVRSAIKSHPFKTAGIVGGGLANIAGLTDNDKVGGQIAGLAGGAILPWLIGASNPSTYVLGSLTGGTLGSLFDKLRQQQEDEYNQNAYIQG